MSLPGILKGVALAALVGTAGTPAEDTGEPFSDILGDVGAYGRAVSVARACGMDAAAAERTLGLVMVYAYAAARPRFASEDHRRTFIVKVLQRISEKHEVGKPGRKLCARSFKAIDHLPVRLDEAVRKAG